MDTKERGTYFGPILVSFALMGLLGGCGREASITAVDGDFEIFESIEALAREADSVVVGTIGEVLLRKVNPSGGLPHIYLELIVDKVFLGPERTGQKITIDMLDADSIDFEQVTPLRNGDAVVLFLDRITADEGPSGVVPFDVVYVPLSLDNGVMDVSGDHAVSRSDDLVAVRDEDVAAERENPTGDGRFIIRLEELSEVLPR